MFMKYDVIVCGGGPSGMNAAISAKRNGMKVLLIESTGLLGGNNVLALVGPWMTFHKNNKRIIGGIAAELASRLETRLQSLGHIKDPLGFCDTITPFDVEGLKALLFDVIEEEEIDLLLHSRVIGAIMEEKTIKGVKVSTRGGELEFFADVIIDATGEGDVSTFANAQYLYGRKKDGLAQPMTMIFHVGGVDIEALKQEMKKNPTDFVIGKDYDYDYLAISGFFKKIEEARENGDFDIPRDRVLLFQEVLPNTVSVNMTRVQFLSGVDAFELTKAEIAARRQIKVAFSFLKKYIPGFEHSFLLRTPSQIGIRETRHILGDYLIDLEDMLEERDFEDSIALCGFPMDIHSPTGADHEWNSKEKNTPYEIPMRSLLVKDVEGLIVSGRCISATHEASSSLRLTPTAMAIGEAAGVLASISVKEKCSPRNVNPTLVQDQLYKQGQIFKRSQSV